jgi:WD40 repeat protein
MWNAATGSINELMHLPETGSDYVSSVAWIQQGDHIAIGTAESGVQLWDVQAGR